MRALICVILILLLSSCSPSIKTAYRNPNFHPQLAGLIGILPFENFSDYPYAGEIISRYLEEEILATGRFDVMSKEKLMEMVKHKGLSFDGLEGKGNTQNIGEAIGLDTIMTGQVMEFRYKEGTDRSPCVAFKVSLIRVKTGETLWTATVSAKKSKFLLPNPSLSVLSHKLAKKAIKSLPKK